MYTQTLHFSGLHCDACIKLITKKLSKLDGVESVSLSGEGQFKVTANRSISKDEVIQLFVDTEYQLVKIIE